MACATIRDALCALMLMLRAASANPSCMPPVTAGREAGQSGGGISDNELTSYNCKHPLIGGESGSVIWKGWHYVSMCYMSMRRKKEMKPQTTVFCLARLLSMPCTPSLLRRRVP